MFKKGFTLIELLAVIVILAIIALIATPRIMAAIEQARKEAFRNDVYGIVKAVERDYVKRILDEEKIEVIYEFEDYNQTVAPEHIDDLAFTGRGPKNGTIVVDEDGNVDLALDDDNWCASKSFFSSEVLVGEYIEGECIISGGSDVVVIDPENLPGDCVVASDEDFIEPYEGDAGIASEYIGSDKCVYIPHVIQGQNITSYEWMFEWSEVEKVISDNTNISSAEGMFFGNSAESLDLSMFDASSIEDMTRMFAWISATSIDLTNFDTSSSNNMHVMFIGLPATSLDVSSFDTSNVTDMYGMFWGSAVEHHDLTNFDTSNVTDMVTMFYDTTGTSVDLSSFDTSSVEDMYHMFRDSNFEILDLSSFDTSNILYMDGMFMNAVATTGYARTQADADRFNATDWKPEELVFVVN